MEAINPALEYLADFVSHEKYDQIKKVKDLAAAGVLIAATTAIITRLIIFPENLNSVYHHKIDAKRNFEP